MDESCLAHHNRMVKQNDRRRFLKGAGGVAGLALLGLHPDVTFSAASGVGSDPFTLGVASGDPLTDQYENASVVLWTRLAPKPLDVGGGMPNETVSVSWQVAEDESFSLGLRQGTTSASPDFAHSVHVEVDGLAPATVYYYRFSYSTYVSPVGRTKTAPVPGSDIAQLSFAFASCQRWDEGFYYAYRHMKDQDLDLVVHLGDYIYENIMPADGGVRNTMVPLACRPEPVTLDQYRLRYALYKTDPDLQAAHARFPWIVTWDDHEVENDYASDYPEGASAPDPSFRTRRTNAYMAYYEHMPVRMGPDMRLYRRLTYGNLAEFNVLDTRQYRSNQMCGDGESPPCEAAWDPSVTMTGPEQERWLLDGLTGSQATWNVIANQVLMAQLDHDTTAAGERYWNDSWDGYPAARQRVLTHIAGLVSQQTLEKPFNVVVITGDWHSSFVNDLKVDFKDRNSPIVATEFVGTSITSNGDSDIYQRYYGPMIPHNPHIKFFDGVHRGYVLCKLDRDRWVTDLLKVSSVTKPTWSVSKDSFVVRSGVPGATAFAPSRVNLPLIVVG